MGILFGENDIEKEKRLANEITPSPRRLFWRKLKRKKL
jgi:hypothetical protein